MCLNYRITPPTRLSDDGITAADRWQPPTLPISGMLPSPRQSGPGTSNVTSRLPRGSALPDLDIHAPQLTRPHISLT